MKPRYKSVPDGYTPQIHKTDVRRSTGAILKNLISLLRLRSDSELHDWLVLHVAVYALHHQKKLKSESAICMALADDQMSAGIVRMVGLYLHVPSDLIIGRLKNSDRRRRYWLNELTWDRGCPDTINARVTLRTECRAKNSFAHPQPASAPARQMCQSTWSAGATERQSARMGCGVGTFSGSIA